MAPYRILSTRRRFLNQSACLAAATVLSKQPYCAAQTKDQHDRFELSLHQYSLKKLFDTGELTLAQYPAFVRDTFGFRNVEFAEEFLGDVFDQPRIADQLRQQSMSLGVTHRVLLCAGDHALDAPSESKRKEALEHHLKVAAVAQRLGCQFMRVRASTEGDRNQQLDHAAAGIGELCTKLQSKPISILIENITGFSRDPQWLVELVNRIGRDRVGLIADFGNFNGDLYAGMATLLPYTKSVCTKSWDFDDQGNETRIDYRRMMEIISQSSFRGCIAIEYLGDKPIEGVRATAKLIRKYW